MKETVIRAEDLPALLQKGAELECLRFEQCDLSGSDLSDVLFIECIFSSCNFSNAQLSRTSFRECAFLSCKMIGLRFEDCLPFLQPPVFKECDLHLSSFVGVKLVGIRYERCMMKEVDFSQAVLTQAVFSYCDLSGALFERTDLKKADLRTSMNFNIDPERNSVRKMHVSIANLESFLSKYELLIQ